MKRTSLLLSALAATWISTLSAAPAHAEDLSAIDWSARIDQANGIADPVEANYAITRMHRELSLALRQVIGADGGANFHTWAVCGSNKAGETIRGEDVPGALPVAHAGHWVGCQNVRGVISQAVSGCWFPDAVQGELNHVAAAISRGNRLVLENIGKVSGRFVHEFASAAEPDPIAIDAFAATIGDEGLSRAFRQYWNAKYEKDLKRKHEYMLLGNLYAILHEHQLLQPIISDAVPIVTRLFTTGFLLKFRVGDEVLDVSQDVPLYEPNHGLYPWSLRGLSNPELVRFLDTWDHSLYGHDSKAMDWTDINDRMNFICTLFRTRHLKPELFDAP
jgi:hypothetical protein